MTRRLGIILVSALMLSVLAGCSAQASDDPGEGTPNLSENAGEPAPVEGDGAAGALILDDATLAWNVEGENLAVTVSAPTDGWVAVGFEPVMAMKDADIVIGYVSGGEVFLRDDFGDGPTSHKPDVDLGGTDDLSDIGGSEADGVTTLSFTIPLDSGDPYDRVLTPGTTVKVLVAHGREGADNFDSYHGWAETTEITI